MKCDGMNVLNANRTVGPWQKPNRAGVTFRQPKLYCFSQQEIIVVREWPDLRCWRKTEEHGWHAWMPFGLALPSRSACSVAPRKTPRASEQLAQFWQTLPEAIMGRLESFPNNHFPLAWLFSRAGKAAVDLSFSNPALAYTLSHCQTLRGDLKGRNWARTLTQVTRRRQQDILGWLGAPIHTEAAVSIMKKLSYASLDSHHRSAYLLQSIMNPLARKRLSHLSRINAGAIALTAPIVLPHVTQALLEEVASDFRRDTDIQAYQLLADACRMMAALDFGVPGPMRSRREIVEFHRSLLEDYTRLQRHIDMGPFPTPPVPGGPGITPICNGYELEQEASRMHHCVFGYGPMIRTGNVYIYHVETSAESATLELQRGTDGRWKLAQLSGTCNRPCRDNVWRVVWEWLRSWGGGSLIGVRAKSPVPPPVGQEGMPEEEEGWALGDDMPLAEFHDPDLIPF